jgi:MFS-type transporter involved in bile tolerance (Atg22 family)
VFLVLISVCPSFFVKPIVPNRFFDSFFDLFSRRTIILGQNLVLLCSQFQKELSIMVLISFHLIFFCGMVLRFCLEIGFVIFKISYNSCHFHKEFRVIHVYD